MNLAGALYNIHSSGLSLSGFEPEDIWISYKGLKCVISGMESKIGCPLGTETSRNADVKNFAALTAALFPEYDKIPVAGLTIKHALMGSGKVSMEKVYFTLKKEALKRNYDAKPLSELLTGDVRDTYRTLSESVLPPTAQAGAAAVDEDFSEMYSKVFG